MKLINNSENALCHGDVKGDFYRLEVGKVLDVPKAIADIWLKIEGVAVHVDAEDIEKEKEKAVKEALAKVKAESKKESKSKSKKK